MIRQLIKLGFSKFEANIYLDLLKHPESELPDIIQRTKLKRSTACDNIAKLQSLGYVGLTTKDKRPLYTAQDPNFIYSNIKKKQNIAHEIMPELFAIANAIEHKPKVKYFYGEAGIQEVAKRQLETKNSELLIWSPIHSIKDTHPLLLKQFIKKRLSHKIWVRKIAPDTEDHQYHQKLDKNSLRQTRLMSCEKYPIYVELSLFGNKYVSIISYHSSLSIIIESKAVHNTIKAIFEYNWQKLA